MSPSNRERDPAPDDEAAIATMSGVLEVHRNQTSWFNNASFALPLLAAVVVLLAGLVTRNSGLLGFAGFLFVITVCMVPVVLVSWRQTATAVVLTADGISSLHSGRPLKSLSWSTVSSVTRRETQGNVRWIVAADNGERIALDGELERLDALVDSARRLAGVTERLE